MLKSVIRAIGRTRKHRAGGIAMNWSRALRRVSILIVGSAVAACAVADKFGSRGADYNAEILEAQNRTLFLNIVRASFGHPLAFTSLSTSSGTATASAQLGLSFPFIHNSIDAVYTAAPQVSASGGPTFTVSNLDTQEFMQGILKPVPLQTLDYYLQEGLPSEIIFYLLIGKVVVTDGDDKPLGHIYNYVRDPKKFGVFQKFIRAARRLRTEEVDSVKNIGPRLMAKDLAAVVPMVKADQAGLKIATLKRKDLSEDEQKALPAGVTEVYQLRKVTPDYRFCFLPKDPKDTTAPSSTIVSDEGDGYPIEPPPASLCGATEAERTPPDAAASAGANPANSPKSNAKMGYQTLTFSGTLPADKGTPSTARKLAIYPRSTEGVVYYLGEITRAQLENEKSKKRGDLPVMVRTHDEPGDTEAMARIFDARKSWQAGKSLVTVSYMDDTYSLAPDDDFGKDRSAQVLSILTQLLNLNKSAKDLPASNVVTLIGR